MIDDGCLQCIASMVRRRARYIAGMHSRHSREGTTDQSAVGTERARVLEGAIVTDDIFIRNRLLLIVISILVHGQWTGLKAARASVKEPGGKVATQCCSFDSYPCEITWYHVSDKQPSGVYWR